MGATSALVFRNLDCLSLFAFRANTTLLAFKTLLFLFFPKSALLNWECSLSTDAAYTWTFTVLHSMHAVFTCCRVSFRSNFANLFTCIREIQANQSEANLF